MLKNKNFQKAFAVLSAAAFLGSIGGNVEAMKGKGKKPGAHSKLSLEDKQKKKEEVDKKRREAAERKEEEERIRQVKLLEEQKAEYEAKKPEREAEKAKIEAEKAEKKAFNIYRSQLNRSKTKVSEDFKKLPEEVQINTLLNILNGIKELNSREEDNNGGSED